MIVADKNIKNMINTLYLSAPKQIKLFLALWNVQYRQYTIYGLITYMTIAANAPRAAVRITAPTLQGTIVAFDPKY